MSVNGIRYWTKSVDRFPTEIAKRIKNVYDRFALMTDLFFVPAYDGWQAVQVDTPTPHPHLPRGPALSSHV